MLPTHRAPTHPGELHQDHGIVPTETLEEIRRPGEIK